MYLRDRLQLLRQSSVFTMPVRSAGAWALDGLGLASLVTMFPFYIRYVLSPDGVTAMEKGQAMDPNVCVKLMCTPP